MVDYISAFREDLDTAEPKLRRISDAVATVPRAPGKWSAKQVLGHLIDSASVNHERFVRAVQLDDLVFPGYDQDAWVEAQRYADANEPEIGWLIHRECWRRGYATEAGSAVRDHAFRSMNLERVVSLIRPVNEPSQGVARKIGMVVERETGFHGYRHLVFAARRD
jgi:RimJ/RimL family protein N-acetyltransferase